MFEVIEVATQFTCILLSVRFCRRTVLSAVRLFPLFRLIAPMALTTSPYSGILWLMIWALQWMYLI